LALFTVFAMAQNPSAQDRPDQSQQLPQAQQPTPQSGGQQAGGADQSVQQIQAALQQQPELANVTVSAAGDKIELSGTVAKKEDKEKAKSVAESAAGGKKVVDKIKVSESSGGSQGATPPPPK
jgi:osmotically-inducible protein OsmY